MIQIQCIHDDVNGHPMHKVSALDEHQHQQSEPDLNRFLSNKTYACINLIHAQQKKQNHLLKFVKTYR